MNPSEEIDSENPVKSNSRNDEKTTKSKGISMTWENLRVSANVEEKHNFQRTRSTFKEIIHNVKGYVEPNGLVAILGASGSGKSTLMSVLANRQAAGLKVCGDVRVNGKRVKLEVMKTICGFVYQEDIFTHPMTVSEHLHFAGKIKLSKHLTAKQRENLVNKVITDVGLVECANRLIGSSNYGTLKANLSGGELKRLSVATELLTNPLLLFCDEPTTGLDSFAAFNLMKIMSNMTKQEDKTIVCSIHQPSERIFDLFDQVILVQNGSIAFNGTTSDAMVFFQSIGYFYNQNQNPADYLVKSLAVVPGQESQTGDEVSRICIKFQQSQYAEYVDHRIKEESSEKNFTLPKNVEHISWFYMFYLLTYRDALSVIRDIKVQMIQVFSKLLVSVLIGIVMMGSVTRTQEGINALKGVIYLNINQNSLVASVRILNHFPSRMHGFLREYSNDMNTPLIFYLSNVISLIPGILVQGTAFATLLYTLVGLRNDWFDYLAFTGITTAVIFTGSALGILVSLGTNDISTANSILLGIAYIFQPLMGMWVNLRSLPWTISWIRYVSWLTYAVEALFIQQIKDVHHIKCPESPDLPCLKNGQEVLESLDFNAAYFRRDVISICCIYAILQVCGFFVLRIRLYFATSR